MFGGINSKSCHCDLSKFVSKIRQNDLLLLDTELSDNTEEVSKLMELKTLASATDTNGLVIHFI